MELPKLDWSEPEKEALLQERLLLLKLPGRHGPIAAWVGSPFEATIRMPYDGSGMSHDG